jgi:DNA-binding transcriptional MerR regulator
MPKFVVKEIDKKRSIGQVAKELDVQTHVIRFWETKFEQIKPVIGKGDRRYYFDNDIKILQKIKHSLYDEGYTIAGLQKQLSAKGSNSKKNQDLSSTETNTSLAENRTAEYISKGLSDSTKEEIESIMNGIEQKLEKFQNLIK